MCPLLLTCEEEERAPIARRKPTGVVALVDPSADNREMYRAYLMHEGLRVVEAADALGALDVIWQTKPDVLVTELRLPSLSGVHLLRLLDALMGSGKPPSIVVTGEIRTEQHQLALDAGCRALFMKPCPPDALVKVILPFLMIAQQAQSCATTRRDAAAQF